MRVGLLLHSFQLKTVLGPVYGLRVAVASLVGSEIGAWGGEKIDRALGGNGIVGSILGGIIGGALPLHPTARSFVNRLEIDPNRLGGQ